MRCLYRMLYIEGENMNKEIVINAINLVRKYKSETSTIEIKSAAKGFPRRCYDTFSSFSNRNGGLIIFGLSGEKDSVIENRHFGIPTMKREISNYNLPIPKIYNERVSFKVVFRNCFDLSGEQVSVQVWCKSNE